MDLSKLDLDALCADGFTERKAQQYLREMAGEDEKDIFDPDYRAWAHSHGFFAESAYAFGLNEDNYEDYLSDYDYYRLWPLNGWQRIWINDKLTLNALTQDSPLARYVPEYYYYVEQDRLLALCGSGYADGFEGFLDTLRAKGTFACKPCNGVWAQGFHRLDYHNGEFFIDKEPTTTDGLRTFLDENKNAVITEFLRPEASLAAINPLIHTIRVLTLNPTGVDPVPSLTYLRFALDSGETGSGSNYQIPSKAGVGDINLSVDVKTGEFGNSKIVYANEVVDCPVHPVSGAPMEGVIPQWDEIITMVKELALKVNACEYLGFDACLTDKGPMIMEINSHSGPKYIQVNTPVLTDPIAGPYFKAKLTALDALTPEQKERRRRVAR